MLVQFIEKKMSESLDYIYIHKYYVHYMYIYTVCYIFIYIILMRLVYGEDHYLLYLSATAVNNRLNIYILPDFLRVIKLAN